MLFGPPNIQFPDHPDIKVEEQEHCWMFYMGKSWLKWFPEALSAEESHTMLNAFLPSASSGWPWQEESIFLFGRWHKSPRLTLWYGERGYSYSGVWHPPALFPEKVADLKEKAEKWAGTAFNSVLLNCYRNGKDSMGWHADNEKVLGENPIIASLSLGATRQFHLKHRENPDLKMSFSLTSGSCLVMGGALQQDWIHAIPKTQKPVGPRINLTFRYVYG